MLGVSSCVVVRPADRMSLRSLASSSAKCLRYKYKFISKNDLHGTGEKLTWPFY